MDILYSDEASFELKGSYASLIVDPNEVSYSGSGSNLGETPVVSLATTEIEGLNHLDGNLRRITGPGEYGIGEVLVSGYALSSNTDLEVDEGSNESEADVHVIYGIDMDGLRICIIGSIANLPSTQVTTGVEGSDVVVVDTDKSSLPQGGLSRLIRQIEPKAVVVKGSQSGTLAKELAAKDAMITRKVSIASRSLGVEGGLGFYILEKGS